MVLGWSESTAPDGLLHDIGIYLRVPIAALRRGVYGYAPLEVSVGCCARR
jgi:hypothetical protein